MWEFYHDIIFQVGNGSIKRFVRIFAGCFVKFTSTSSYSSCNILTRRVFIYWIVVRGLPICTLTTTLSPWIPLQYLSAYSTRALDSAILCFFHFYNNLSKVLSSSTLVSFSFDRSVAFLQEVSRKTIVFVETVLSFGSASSCQFYCSCELVTVC